MALARPLLLCRRVGETGPRVSQHPADLSQKITSSWGTRGRAERLASRVPFGGSPGSAYSEEVFRHFLAIERKRAERSGRPFLLLLADLAEQASSETRINTDLAVKLFSGLSRCLRETDFIGWHREERVAGAVLTELGGGSGGEIDHQVGQRVGAALRTSLPAEVARRLQISVYRYPELEGADAAGRFHPG